MGRIKLRSMVVAVSGALMMGIGAAALADSNDDLLQTLVAKGVLTEEEGKIIAEGREQEKKNQEKVASSESKIKIADFIDNATFYGDIRVRAEHRDGESPTVEENRDRARYKLTFGIKTKAADFYTDLAFAMGAGGRSDNATFAGDSSPTLNDKEALFVKTAMIGWTATDWLTLEAGRMKNPLYTTPMVWDGDLTFEGLTEKVKFKAGRADVFLTASQSSYVGDHKSFDGSGGDRATNELLAFQGGARFPINENASAKAAITYTTFTRDDNNQTGVFSPGLDSASASAVAANSFGVNDLDTIEIPAEINWMTANNIGMRVFGDYVTNLSGDDRADAACAFDPTVCGTGDDHNAWLLGFAVGSAKTLKDFEANKVGKGDWSARIWYQDVGAYAVDANAVDSDFFDSRVNMKGTIFKAEYGLRDNVFVNLAAGHGSRKDGALGTAGSGDLALNLDSFNLYQLDLTYKF